MKTTTTTRVIVVIAGLSLTGTVLAHHSVPVNFDTNSSHTVSRKLIKTKWLSPHSQMQVEVTMDDGSTEVWLIEMNAINTIRRLDPDLAKIQQD